MTPRSAIHTTVLAFFAAAMLVTFIWNGLDATMVQFATDAQAQRREAPPSREAVQYSFAPIVKKAKPAVVNVYVSSRVKTFQTPFSRDPVFRQLFRNLPGFGAPKERMENSLGSGVIVSADGIIVTNAHVIKQRGKTRIRVALSDNREFDATLLQQDEKSDIAILKIEDGDKKFPFLELADSDALEVGDLVLAIGNPFGVGQTVTSGIISARARSQLKQDNVFIQTDAAINPGNSGGALVNMSGELVGINTAIFSRSGGSNGIGFAIPSNFASLYVKSALTGAKVERPWLGARLENLTRDLVDALGLTRRAGAIVTHIYDRSPAAQAGLKLRDVVINVDGFDVSDSHAVNYRMTTRGIGNASTLTVIRNGKPQKIKVALEPPPKPGPDDIRNLSGDHPFDGVRVVTIGPVVAQEHNIEEYNGVLIVGIARGGAAAQLGFRPGDIILEVADREIKNVRDLDDIAAQPKRSWRITIQRRGRNISFRVPG